MTFFWNSWAEERLMFWISAIDEISTMVETAETSSTILLNIERGMVDLIWEKITSYNW